MNLKSKKDSLKRDLLLGIEGWNQVESAKGNGISYATMQNAIDFIDEISYLEYEPYYTLPGKDIIRIVFGNIAMDFQGNKCSMWAVNIDNPIVPYSTELVITKTPKSWKYG